MIPPFSEIHCFSQITTKNLQRNVLDWKLYLPPTFEKKLWGLHPSRSSGAQAVWPSNDALDSEQTLDTLTASVRISTTTVADLGLELHPIQEKPFEEYLKRGGPLHLLEAVYCDPCKAKVRFLLNFVSPNFKGSLFSGDKGYLARDSPLHWPLQ